MLRCRAVLPAISEFSLRDTQKIVPNIRNFSIYAGTAAAEHRGELPKDLDLSMYVASGVVVYDLVRRSLKWSVHLDLSTDHVSLRCAAFSFVGGWRCICWGYGVYFSGVHLSTDHASLRCSTPLSGEVR